MVALVDELEDKGLVRREVDPDDRRKRVVGLTAEGRRVVEAGTEATAEAERLLLEPLSARDAERLRVALRAVVSGN